MGRQLALGWGGGAAHGHGPRGAEMGPVDPRIDSKRLS